MKRISFIKKLLFPALCLCALVTGCINEDLDECYKLRLKVVNQNGEDITPSGYVKHTALYIFDEKLNYLETRQLDESFITSRDEIVLDNYPASRKLNIVAWGNLNVLGEKQDVSEAQKIEDLKVMLKTTGEQASQPDSLYFGIEQVQTKSGGITENKEVVIHPKTGSVTVQTINLHYGLRKYNIPENAECDFALNKTLSGFDYQGEQIGDSVYYQLNATRYSGVDYKTNERQNACLGEKMGVSLSTNGEVFLTVDKDDNGNEIKTSPSENTFVLLQFAEDGNLSVKVQVRPWGGVDDHIEF
ncbi:FimB/Mfa2 family fimbrial subunit [Parabacteroides gordonii]|uniref:Major fimbrial subunit protein N-terminal domain-containing protein n=1 Tax=Parabacteroides gordonii MS-1 = DSM 23371 TaxID=1203610 RepID=A0A0F5JC70_9BACT|nr:FimB/Mfa2 family fimbrial subunit [Parabacteroides gordonii]KKB55095.1 hypothetical protein HMPREF1536_02549 [Parabacteroides gordonii MS-1 = DSM 23371]MCA5582100.1 FimB/Mfa2 family fimbrial subunit [Parabacteroides gordonii]